MFQTNHEQELYRGRLKIARDESMFRNAAVHAEERGYQKGMEKGMEKGIEQGIEKGLEKGIELARQSQRRNIRRCLLKRFGAISAASENRIEAIADTSKLDSLFDAALSAASIDEFEKLLD